jgi:ureidoglycolate hydrolase
MPEKKELKLEFLSEKIFADYGQVIQNSLKGKSLY